MELRQLRCFLTVVETGQLRLAARRLHVTQPALSRTIRQLEDYLGVTLFRRTGRGMDLTEAGQTLSVEVAPLLARLDSVATSVADSGRLIAGPVTLAAPPSVGAVLAADIIETTRETHASIDLRMIGALSGTVRDGLLRGRFDLGILYDPDPRERLETQRLWRERLWWIVPVGRSRRRRAVDLNDVLAEPLILPAPRHGLRLVVEAHAARVGRRPHVVVEVDSLRVLLELVRRGVGTTLLPRSAVANELESGLVHAIRIEKPAVRRTIVLGWVHGQHLSQAGEAVATIVRQRAAEFRKRDR